MKEILDGPVRNGDIIKTWTKEETEKFNLAIKVNMCGKNWKAVSSFVQTKTEEQCRERFKTLGKKISSGKCID